MVQIDGFSDLTLIGRGGFSRVYRAHQRAFDRQVAVKVLDVDVTSDAARRVFERECELAGRLTGHPNIVTVLGSGYVDGSGEPYIVMEYAPGGSLAALVESQGALKPARVVSVGLALAGALETAHRHGVVHRDVKPQNVVFVRSGAPALTDFGIASVVGYASTTASAQAFTPLHAAPELFRGEPSSPFSDVYGLGSSLYTLLEGSPPFGAPGDTPPVLLGRILTEEPPAPRVAGLPQGLSSLVQGMMAKDPAVRPSLQRVIDDLRAAESALGSGPTDVVVIDGDPTTAAPATTGGSSTGAPVVQPAAAGGGRRLVAALVAALLVVGVGVGVWQARSAPAPAAGPTQPGVAALSATDVRACALTDGGRMQCWGQNDNGQLGDGTTTSRSAPVDVAGVTGIRQIAVGQYFTCALLNDGTVSCWGGNANGQLGRGTVTREPPANPPAPVQGITGAVQLVTRDWATCALRADGTAACWGGNSWGALGDGTTNDSPVPRQVDGLLDATSLSEGFFHTCAIRTEGRVSCWGKNDKGQLGDGTTTDRLTPVEVSGLRNVRQLSLGEEHSCAVRVDGTVWCWGSNASGQLGIDKNQTLIPVQVPDVGPTGQLVAGNAFTCAATVPVLLCWGMNENGQLGTGEAGSPRPPGPVRLV